MDNLTIPSYWLEVDGLNIHFKCLGKGLPVILLHGGANDWHEWEKNLAFLAKGLRVYALDLPGYGLSESPNILVSPSWFRSFLSRFMEALGLREAHLIGHSLGGTIALAFALDFPERVKKIVLVDSASLGEISRKGQLILFLIKGIKRMAGKEKKKPKFETSPTDDWLLTNRLPELKPSVMIVWGENDPYLPVSQARLAHHLIPNSQLHVFPRSRHAPHRERPDKFNHLVYQFLTEQSPS